MVKVQEKKIGDKYSQLWIPLPKKICEELQISKGIELQVSIENGDLILRREFGMTRRIDLPKFGRAGQK